MKKFGIDISSYQRDINWNKVKQNVEFVIMRAGYGRLASQKDDFFEENYKKCKDNGIPCGVYWYSYALTKDDALKEADACIEVIKNKKFEYPVYFDIEDGSQSRLGREKISEISEAFCKRLENAGYWVGIYSYKSFLENNINENVRKRYAIWIAHTGVENTNYSGQYGIWQFSHTGNIDGINGDVDCNYCYTDYPELMKQTGKNNLNIPEKTDNYEYYTVKNGDTLWDIAVKYYGNGSEYKKIKELNNLNSDTIYAGQVIKILK